MTTLNHSKRVSKVCSSLLQYIFIILPHNFSQTSRNHLCYHFFAENLEICVHLCLIKVYSAYQPYYDLHRSLPRPPQRQIRIRKHYFEQYCFDRTEWDYSVGLIWPDGTGTTAATE